MRELGGFALMGLTSALAVPATFMLIRELVSTRLGLPAAGFWQASWKISEIYLMLVTTTLSVYYLPRLAEIRSAADLRAEIGKVYQLVLPLVALGALAIYLLRDPIVRLLFTPDFLPMRDLFGWQLAGDVVKIGSWILAYVMLGRALVRTFVITEIAFALLFVGLAAVLTGPFGLTGVAMAYCINYVLYWITMALVVRREMLKMEPCMPTESMSPAGAPHD
jgi:PST family polysaccharide transporter